MKGKEEVLKKLKSLSADFALIIPMADGYNKAMYIEWKETIDDAVELIESTQ